jgi:uncharacterized protein (TIGR02118 family)
MAYATPAPIADCAGAAAASLCASGTKTREDNMARLVALYKTPKDTAAFDAYYRSTHIPLAKKIPGLRAYDISRGPVATPAGPSDFHLVATLTFDSMDALQAALASPEGQATAGDLANFADGGVELLVFETADA